MRKILYVLLTVSVAIGVITSCENKPENNFKITINVSNGDDGMILMSKREAGEMINYDSVQLIEGKGIITGNIDLPEFYYLRFKGSKNYVPVFVEAGDIVVEVDMNNINTPLISGSLSHEKYLAYNDSVSSFDEQASLLGKQYGEASQNNDTVLMQEIEDQYMTVDDKKIDYLIEYAKNNNDNVVSAFLILNNSYNIDFEDIDEVVAGFAPSIDSSTYIKSLKKHVVILKRSAIGQPYIDFTLNNTDGTPVTLSSLLNDNYVLVDFWASWCSPCRAENPNVVLAYNNFHDKGFDVVGVSFDKDYDKWIEAIAADNLSWTQVSDLKYWNCAAGKLYGIQSIPQNVLIDPNGIIIEKNLRGQGLQDKLAELLD